MKCQTLVSTVQLLDNSQSHLSESSSFLISGTSAAFPVANMANDAMHIPTPIWALYQSTTALRKKRKIKREILAVSREVSPYLDHCAIEHPFDMREQRKKCVFQERCESLIEDHDYGK